MCFILKTAYILRTNHGNSLQCNCFLSLIFVHVTHWEKQRTKRFWGETTLAHVINAAHLVTRHLHCILYCILHCILQLHLVICTEFANAPSRKVYCKEISVGGGKQICGSEEYADPVGYSHYLKGSQYLPSTPPPPFLIPMTQS